MDLLDPPLPEQIIPESLPPAPPATIDASADAATAQAASPPVPQPVDPDRPAYNHTRTGKVARLPKTVRDQINQMLLDGVPFLEIIQRLGDAGKDLNEDNITSWKKGGFKDWLVEMQRLDDLGATREAALSLVSQKAGPTVQDAGRTIASAQLYELLLSFDPRSFAQALAEKPELYFRLINALSRLSEGEANCSRRRAQGNQNRCPRLRPQGQSRRSPL